MIYIQQSVRVGGCVSFPLIWTLFLEPYTACLPPLPPPSYTSYMQVTYTEENPQLIEFFFMKLNQLKQSICDHKQKKSIEHRLVVF